MNSNGLMLRWFGGSGGDTICTLIDMAEKDLYTNFICKYNSRANGKTNTHQFKDPEYPTLYRFGISWNAEIELKKAKKDLSKLKNSNKKFLIKSMNFAKSLDNVVSDYMEIVSIGYDYFFLPFLVQTNLTKTKTIKNYFTKNNLSKYKKDLVLLDITKKLSQDQKTKLVIWNVIKSAIDYMNDFSLDKSSIQISDMFYNQQSIKDFFADRNIEIDFNNKLYKNWLKLNQKYIPSDIFNKCLKTRSYNYQNSDMNLFERYVLLAISGKKFKFLS
tara:strand:+ start:2239 stop:3057 length:819 start_codon:yes stop_codon:yes gene_type:complete